ncbi:MAG: ATP-dependent Clp protease adaptor protein ClpS [Gammaproteobacteria bacterium]|jgi:ATP-dependent Clp protease adaptor protein ClpS
MVECVIRSRILPETIEHQITVSAHHDDDHLDSGVSVAPERPKLKRPPLFKVVLLNDDYTPMEFVVTVLSRFFRMGGEKATQVMLEVHTKGKGVCGVYSPELAETKTAQVNSYARENQHPLLCVVEPANE